MMLLSFKSNYIFVSVFIALLFCACGEPIEFGHPGDAKKTDIGRILAKPAFFANEKVQIKGYLKLSDGRFEIFDRHGSLMLAPVDFHLPDSLTDFRAVCQGEVFYQEEMGLLGIRADYIKVLP